MREPLPFLTQDSAISHTEDHHLNGFQHFLNFYLCTVLLDNVRIPFYQQMHILLNI